MRVLTFILWNIVRSFAFRIHGDEVDVENILKALQDRSEEETCKILNESNVDTFREETIFDLAASAINENYAKVDAVSVLHCLKDHLNVKGTEKETLLFPAVMSGNLRALKVLIDSVPVASRNRNGISAAEKALLENPEKCLESLKVLLIGQLDPNQPCPKVCTPNENLRSNCEKGWTLAHFASSNRNFAALPILQQYNANLNQKDDAGFSPVHVAVRRQRLQALSELKTLNASWRLSVPAAQ